MGAIIAEFLFSLVAEIVGWILWGFCGFTAVVLLRVMTLNRRLRQLAAETL